MIHRSARLLVVLLALVASGGAMYWAYQDELALRQSAVTERQALDVADHALATTADLRAALQAYVAAGQGPEFWMSRSDALMQDLQGALATLTPPGDEGAPALAAEAMGRLAGADKRARAFVRERQERLAADVVFIECRNHLEAVRLQITGAREREVAAAAARATVLRREQYVLVGSLVAVWFVAAFLLLPVPVSAPAMQPAAPEDTPAQTARTPRPAAHVSTAPPAAASSPQRDARVVRTPAPVPHAAAPRLPEAAQVCGELARASDAGQMTALLARAADVIGAAGLVVWVASPDATTLVPAASCGYDERVLASIGALPVEADNVTASAFRDSAGRTTPSRPGAPAALAVPLVGPAGRIGVLSGELRQGDSVGEAAAALASIFAAQLATLVGSIPTADPTADGESPESQEAQA